MRQGRCELEPRASGSMWSLAGRGVRYSHRAGPKREWGVAAPARQLVSAWPASKSATPPACFFLPATIHNLADGTLVVDHCEPAMPGLRKQFMLTWRGEVPSLFAEASEGGSMFRWATGESVWTFGSRAARAGGLAGWRAGGLAGWLAGVLAG